MAGIIKRLMQRTDSTVTQDGFISFSEQIRGMGDRDTLGAFKTVNLTRNPMILNAVYRNSWIAAKIVDCLAEDMTKDGIKINGLSSEEETSLQKYLTKKNVWRALTDTVKWARLYGGAVCFINIEGQDPETPLDLSTIMEGQFLGLKVLDRYRVNPEVENLTLLDDEPEFYTFPEIGARVHKSRIIKFVGVKLPSNLEAQENYWGDSIISRVYDSVRVREGALQSSAKLVSRAWLRTVKVDGMRPVLTAGGKAEQNLVKFFKTMVEMQDSTGLTLMDKLDEFQTNSYTFSGLDQLLRTYDQDVAGAADIPITRLYGQSPAGFSTGESDLKTYYDKISSLQESMLREPLTKILDACYYSLFGKAPATGVLDFEFLNPWQPSEMEDRAQSVAESDVIIRATQAGIIDIDTAMRELRNRGKRFGLFSSITEEDIQKNASNIEPPVFDLDAELEQPLETATAAEQGLDSLDKPLE